MSPAWQSPPDPLPPPGTDVHVWLLDLNSPPERERALAAILSDDEFERAGRFYFEHLRTHYITARGALRILLGHYLGTAPQDFRFAYSEYRKPYLRGASLQFNISHSHERALLAFTEKRIVGVDIEHLRPMRDAESIARRFFSPAEVEAFLALPEEQREPAFFNCWTRKEAYIKAVGEGLSHPLDTFDVTLAPGEPARFLAFRESPSELDRWKLAAFEPAPGYQAALTAEGRDWNPLFYDASTLISPPDLALHNQ